MLTATCASALCAGANKIPAAIAIKASGLNVFIYLPFTDGRQLKHLPDVIALFFPNANGIFPSGRTIPPDLRREARKEVFCGAKQETQRTASQPDVAVGTQRIL